MSKTEVMCKINENVSKNKETDRMMCFSMWFFISVATFGIALFPMFYLLIERRNRHFLRQNEFIDMVLELKSMENHCLSKGHANKRNSILWAASIVFIFPIFIIAYMLTKDLILHEKEQRRFFSTFFSEKDFFLQTETINLKLYLIITALTLGVGVIYWYYKIFNHYNNHFKKQWIMEDKVVKMLESEANER